MTKSHALPSRDEVAEWLLYCPLTGQITWRKDRWYNAKEGSEAGCICSITGYRRIRLGCKRKHQAHRIAWLLHYGVDPHPLEIDHIDGNRQNNKIANLRTVTRQQNQFNRRKNKNNTSGYKGVYRYKDRWRAGLRINNRIHWLGIFSTPELAAQAWKDAAERTRGEYNFQDPSAQRSRG
jgi:hypothetical protein